MFASVSRRLALLNAAVVMAIIGAVGLLILGILQQSLDREADEALHDRADAAIVTWQDLFAAAAEPRTLAAVSPSLPALIERHDDDGEEDEPERDESGEELDDAVRELLASGDTIAYALGMDGSVLADARGVPIGGLPLREPLPQVLQGETDIRTVTLSGAPVRVLTEPVRVNGDIAGAVQVAQGQAERQSEMRQVQLATLGGTLVGAIIAVPAGLFLSRRAMRPIQIAFARQRAFVADASHELRTPLTVLRAQTELLQRTPPAEIEPELETLLNEIDDMSRLVSDLLLLARADEASLTLDRTTVDMVALVHSTVEKLRPAADRAGLTLETRGAGPVTATVDDDRIRQVLRILLDNAIAYTPAGGAVTVTTQRKAERAVIEVHDTGIGIPEDDLPRIFDRFYRAERSRSRAKGGAGLGLTIAKAIVEAHGGSIAASSPPGDGTILTVSVPVAAGTIVDHR